MSRRIPDLPNSARNPFMFGGELHADALVDRRDELALLQRIMASNGKLFLIGRRRFGKTSLLAAAEANADRDRGPVVIRQDAERYLGPTQLAEAILTEASRKLMGSVDRATAALQRLAGALRPEISVDPQTGSFTIAVGSSRSDRAPIPALAEVLDVVDRLGSEAKRPVTVMIDEFQHLVTRDGEAAERQLRATVQRHHHVGYIFAGSAVRLLADMVGNHARPFYRLGTTLVLQRLPRDEFASFLTSAFQRQRWSVHPDAITELLHAADEVPYSVQRVAHAAWEMLRVEGRGAVLSPDVVTRALRQVINQEGPMYAQLWNGLTDRQRRALAAIATLGGDQPFAQARAARTGMSTSSMQRALAALSDPTRGLVVEEAREAKPAYTLEDPLFAAWIRMSGRE